MNYNKDSRFLEVMFIYILLITSTYLLASHNIKKSSKLKLFLFSLTQLRLKLLIERLSGTSAIFEQNTSQKKRMAKRSRKVTHMRWSDLHTIRIIDNT